VGFDLVSKSTATINCFFPHFPFLSLILSLALFVYSLGRGLAVQVLVPSDLSDGRHG
jgi:hypothetical protein